MAFEKVPQLIFRPIGADVIFRVPAGNDIGPFDALDHLFHLSRFYGVLETAQEIAIFLTAGRSGTLTDLFQAYDFAVAQGNGHLDPFGHHGGFFLY